MHGQYYPSGKLNGVAKAKVDDPSVVLKHRLDGSLATQTMIGNNAYL